VATARRGLLFIVAAWGCAHAKPADPAPAPAVAQGPQARVVVETLTVRDPDTDRRIGRLEMKALERDAQIADLQSRLEDATQEVVRAMAKLQTIASRAEAASGMAEAEVALRTLKTGAGSAPEVAQASQLLERSSTEFNKQNYGGALYLANTAKQMAAAGRGRLVGDAAATPRPGETAFAVPIGLKATGRGNVREGPGTSFKVAFAVETGGSLTGFSYLDDWIRVVDEGGRSGWIFRNLVGKR
jgi:hypothetical protein